MSPLNQVLVQWFVKCLSVTLAMLSIRNWTMWHKNILYDKRSLQSDVHLETMEAVPTRCLLMKSIKYEVLMSADTQTLHSNNITDFCKTTINCTTHNNYTIRNNTQTDTEATCLMLTPRLSSKKINSNTIISNRIQTPEITVIGGWSLKAPSWCDVMN